MVQKAVQRAGSNVEGRDPDELLEALSSRRGPERILDLMLRTGPYGDGFGADPSGLSLTVLEQAPHGVDLGPLQPRVPEVLRTPSGKIELAPEPIVEDVARLRAKLPPEVLLVLDAAYAEYVIRPDYDPGMKLVDAAGNTVMTRTFSKIFGLGGMRIGWCYAPPAVVDVLNRVRGPFNVSVAAQHAAIAALGEPGWVEQGRRHNAEYRPRLAAAICKITEARFVRRISGSVKRGRSRKSSSLYRRMQTPGDVRPDRPLRWSADACEMRSIGRRCTLSRAL